LRWRIERHALPDGVELREREIFRKKADEQSRADARVHDVGVVSRLAARCDGLLAVSGLIPCLVDADVAKFPSLVSLSDCGCCVR
jgi:hypothetical protein